MLILQEMLITIGTLESVRFKNCDLAPDLGGSIIMALNFFNSSDVRGLLFKFLDCEIILFP